MRLPSRGSPLRRLRSTSARSTLFHGCPPTASCLLYTSNSEFAPSAQITLCDDPSPRDIAEFAVKILDSKKARDIKLLYVEDQTSIADWFVVCTGTSSTHIDSLAQEVEYSLSKYGIAPLHTEGGRGDSWILADYGAVILLSLIHH